MQDNTQFILGSMRSPHPNFNYFQTRAKITYLVEEAARSWGFTPLPSSRGTPTGKPVA